MSEELKEMQNETQPTMKDFEEEINRSFHRIKEGDILTGTVIAVTETEVTVDLGSYTEGIIPLGELSSDPEFSIKDNIKNGDVIKAEVMKEDDGNGSLLLSCKKANMILAWEEFRTALNEKTIFTVKPVEAVNAGVVAYLKGIRAFIPASQLALTYVENPSDFVGKTLEAIIITADESKQKLVLSAKEVERNKAAAEKTDKISKLQVGLVTKGTVETIKPYGAFVSIGEGLSGLVHISQICQKHIKTPNEIVKEGEEVTVKIIDVKDGKVSLSMKAVSDDSQVLDKADEALAEYVSNGEAATSLSGLLAGIKLS